MQETEGIETTDRPEKLVAGAADADPSLVPDDGGQKPSANDGRADHQARGNAEIHADLAQERHGHSICVTI